MKPEVYFYKGFFIQKDICGDGYNIFKGYQLYDEGYATLKKAVEEVDNYISSRENNLPWEE